MSKLPPTSTREQFLEALLDSATDHAIIGTDLDGRVTAWNEGAHRILGWSEEEALGQPAHRYFTPEDRAVKAPEIEMEKAARNGHAADERWHLRKDGSRFWGSGEMTPLVEDGKIQGFLKIVRDRTESRLARERQKVLARELSHRMKNTLAIVQSLAMRIFREGVPVKEARASFDARIVALGAAHDVLIKGEWVEADFQSVIVNAVAGVIKPEPPQLRVKGPTLSIGPGAAVSFALVIHELATNAAKHGAFSAAEGYVSVDWKVVGEGARLQFCWSEHGGPEVTAPQKSGLGSLLIRSLFQRRDAVELR